MKDKNRLRVVVVGGGASGMTAALAAAEQGAEVILLERQARLGRKLAATGNGRCNLSNLHASPAHYHGEDPSFCACALEDETVSASLRRFRDMGLLTVQEEDGKIYPMSDHAGSVVDVLRFSLDAAGVCVRCGSSVDGIRAGKHGFQLLLRDESVSADRVVIACGGVAGGKLGGVLDGYRLLESLGHHCTPLHPALVQLRTEAKAVRGLKGVRTRARVQVYRAGAPIAEELGEVQFTEYGLSGPAVFAVARAAVKAGDSTVYLDLFPEMSRDALYAHLLHRIHTRPQLTMDDLFTGTVQNRLGRMLISAAGLSGSLPLRDAEDLLLPAVQLAKAFPFRVAGDLGFEQAQVTSGGIRTSEFEKSTMESRIRPGLFACGEVMDIDGDCGGYNLQWAWSSGRLAGSCAGRGAESC